jgi:hypothetical protein
MMKHLLFEIALLIGPVLAVGSGFLLVAFQVQRVQQNLDHQVTSLRQRDDRWDAAIQEIRDHVKLHESSMKLEQDNLGQILHWQQEILAAIRERKIGDLMTSQKSKKWLSGETGDFVGEIATDMSTGR